jgi:hypothetical protein
MKAIQTVIVKKTTVKKHHHPYATSFPALTLPAFSRLRVLLLLLLLLPPRPLHVIVASMELMNAG